MKNYFCFIACAAFIQCALSATANLEASMELTGGCYFVDSTDGVLTLDSSMQSMSTENPGGQRPKVTVHLYGNNATLTRTTAVVWKKNGAVVSNIQIQNPSSENIIQKISSSIALTGASSASVSLLGSGMHVFTWAVKGVHANLFTESGKWEASTQMTCT